MKNKRKIVTVAGEVGGGGGGGGGEAEGGGGKVEGGRRGRAKLLFAYFYLPVLQSHFPHINVPFPLQYVSSSGTCCFIGRVITICIHKILTNIK